MKAVTLLEFVDVYRIESLRDKGMVTTNREKNPA